MSKSNILENAMLALLYNGTAIPNVADNAANAPLGSVFVALHTADPGEAGTQATNEANYTGYARVAVARNPGGWVAPAAGATGPVANIDFPAGTAGGGTATHFSTGIALAGATAYWHSGPITPTIALGAGVQPRLTTATTITED